MNIFEKFYLSTEQSDSRWLKQFSEYGLITYTLNDVGALVDLARRFGHVYVQDDTDQLGVKSIAGLPAQRGCFLHTDRASMDEPPNAIFVYCIQNSQVGGQSILVDGKQVYEQMIVDYPNMVRIFKKEHSVAFGIGELLSLQSILNDDPYQNSHVYFKYRSDPHGFFSKELVPYLPVFDDLLNQHCFSIPLHAGQGYMLQNGRWLHGAKSAEVGKRKLARVLVDCRHRCHAKSLTSFGFATKI